MLDVGRQDALVVVQEGEFHHPLNHAGWSNGEQKPCAAVILFDMYCFVVQRDGMDKVTRWHVAAGKLPKEI